MSRSIRFGEARFRSSSWTARAAASLALCAAVAGADRASAGPVTVPATISTISNVTVPKVSLPSVTVPRVTVPVSVVPTAGFPAGIGDHYVSVLKATWAEQKSQQPSTGGAAAQTGVITLGGGKGGTQGHIFPAPQVGGGAEEGARSNGGNSAVGTRYYAPTSFSGNNTACGRYPFPPCH
jgi:hypothetical protein